MQQSKTQLLKRTYTEWSSHNALRLAAAMALYVMMSLAPLLVVALTVFTFIYHDKAPEKIQSHAGMLLGNQGGGAIADMIKHCAQHGKGGVVAAIISFIIALISASGLFVSLQEAINTIWDVKPRPDAGWRVMVRSRLVSILVIFGSGIILLASFVVSAALSIIVHHLPSWLSWLSFLGDVVVSLAIITAIFAMVYKFLPDVKLDWKDVWLGAAITAALFVIGKYGLTIYFKYASVASPYGAAGSLAALLIWIYYSAAIVFFGAEFTRVYAESTGKEIKPDKYAVKLTRQDRAVRGEPHPEELEAAQAADSADRAEPRGRRRVASAAPGAATSEPIGAMPAGNGHSSKAVRYIAAGAGLAVGALVGGLGAWGMTSDERKIRARLEELRARDRLAEAERHMHRAAKVHDLLERMNVNERLDAVQDRINRIAADAKKAKTRRTASRRKL